MSSTGTKPSVLTAIQHLDRVRDFLPELANFGLLRIEFERLIAFAKRVLKLSLIVQRARALKILRGFLLIGLR